MAASSIFNPDDGYASPSDLAQALATGARQRGVEIRRGTAITGLTQQGSKWLVETSAGIILADHVVSATGNYAQRSAALLGRSAQSVPVRHQYVITQPLAELTKRRRAGLPEPPVFHDPEQSFYVRQEGDCLLMGAYDGSGDAMFLDDVPQSYGRAPLPDQLDQLLPYVERAIARLPVLETAGIQNVTNSPMPYTPDDLPLIGLAGGLQNLWLAEGTPFGITLAGGIGWQLAEWMAEREPSIDLRSCDSRRFGRWAGRKWSARKVEEAYEHTYILPKPGEELQAARGLRCSPLHDLLDARGAVFGSVLGWELTNWFAPPGIGREETWSFDRPNWFAIDGEECRRSWRAPVATDVSSDTRLRLTGPEAKSVLGDLMNTPAPEPGTVQPGYVLNPSGTVALGLSAACHAPGCFSLTCAPDAEAYALDLVNRAIAARDARVENVTGRIGGLHLFGKGCDALLSDLTGGASDGLATGGTCRAGIGYCPVRISRTGFCGLPGWRIEAATEYMRAVFLVLEERRARLIGARASGAQGGTRRARLAGRAVSGHLARGHRPWRQRRQPLAGSPARHPGQGRASRR